MIVANILEKKNEVVEWSRCFRSRKGIVTTENFIILILIFPFKLTLSLFIHVIIYQQNYSDIKVVLTEVIREMIV